MCESSHQSPSKSITPMRGAVPLLLSFVISRASALNLLQWNPHWQCFVKNEKNCKENAEAALESLLAHYDVDFANIVELADNNYSLPVPWVWITKDCGKDRTALIYNSSRWAPGTMEGSGAEGCMEEGRDRPFVVQQFTAKVPGQLVPQVVVIGAHYPHTAEREALKQSLAFVLSATKVPEVILIADTNENSWVSNDNIMKDIGQGAVTGTNLERTCCYNDNFYEAHTFDRIIANFDGVMSTTVLFDTLPYWARTGEFHKGILGQLRARHWLPGRLIIVLAVFAILLSAVLYFVWAAVRQCSEVEVADDYQGVET